MNEDRTNYARLGALTDEEVERAVDLDDEGEFDWSPSQIGISSPRDQLTVRFDRDVLEWFRAQGPGYQTRMNAVLKGYVSAQRSKE